ncbi:hypothetical protein F4805DRAFT_474523 [Annulohypoxylon moriforme]|nr:hypothetical protein F4805DRAFT_474523 [Annulohypoxylon moriforme]
MEATKALTCANCSTGVLTDLHTCSSCYDVPRYEDESCEVYCNAQCLQEHSEEHKARCELRLKRKRLLRASKLMKATFMTFRECLYGRPLVEIKISNGELHLHIKPEPPFNPWYYPFPDGITTTTNHREAALSIQNCNASASICSPLARQLLEGIASSMELYCVDVKPQMLARYIISGTDQEKPADDYPLHAIIVVCIKEEKWIIDMTGSQFGFSDVLCPFEKYMKQWKGHVAATPCPYPVDQIHDIKRSNFFPSAPGLVVSPEFMAHRAHEEAGRHHLQALIDKRFINAENPKFAADLLNRTEEAFQDGLREWMVEVREHMMGFVRKMTGKFEPDE